MFCVKMFLILSKLTFVYYCIVSLFDSFVTLLDGSALYTVVFKEWWEMIEGDDECKVFEISCQLNKKTKKIKSKIQGENIKNIHINK